MSHNGKATRNKMNIRIPLRIETPNHSPGSEHPDRHAGVKNIKDSLRLDENASLDYLDGENNFRKWMTY